MSALRPSNTKVKHDKTKERSGQEWDTYLRFLSTGALGLLFYMRQDWVRKWTLLIYTFKHFLQAQIMLFWVLFLFVLLR